MDAHTCSLLAPGTVKTLHSMTLFHVESGRRIAHLYLNRQEALRWDEAVTDEH